MTPPSGSVRVLVSDEAAALREPLAGAPFDVDALADGESIAQAVARGAPHVVALGAARDGTPAVRAVRALAEGLHLPILLVVHGDDRAAVLDGLGAGATDYIVAPFDPAVVRAQVLALHRASQVRSEAVRGMWAREQLLAHVYCDLKGPIGSIQAYARLLGEDRAVRAIAACAATAGRLLDNVMDVMRLQTGRLALERETVDLGDVARACVERLRRARCGVAIDLEIGAGSAAALVDRARAGHVIDELLSNAVRFSPPGARVSVTVEPGPEEVVVVVRDCGPGILEHELARVFTLFGVLSTPAAEGIGAGLGLFLAREIVELHGGRIAVESRPGRGSSFHCAFPRAG